MLILNPNTLKKDTFIKHLNNTDACAQILQVLDQTKNKAQLRVLWWNIACDDPFPIGSRNTLCVEEINIKNINEWEVFEDIEKIKNG